MVEYENSENGEEKESSKSGMPFLDHLEELRWRLLKSLLAMLVMTFAAFYFAEEILTFIKRPLDGQQELYATEVTAKFYAYLKIALFAGIFGAIPVIFYQMWSFISPGLYEKEKRIIFPLVLTSCILFLIGAGFCFLVVLPISLSFLLGFTDEVTSIITVGSYINFVGFLLLSFGLGFQMPILAYFLAKINLLTPEFLIKGRRYSIVIILIIGAIMTPPDVFTQILMAVPLYILYELSIIIVKQVVRNKEKKEKLRLKEK